MTTPQRLRVETVKEHLLERAEFSRVIFVDGSTGCGKSSQVPQYLLDEFGGPVLCTQPRRLAVIAIARRVAQERGCELGHEVGYRVGQRPCARSNTQLLFATAGLVLEDIRCNGFAALREYKYIIMDEVHERSCESDLLLACLREFLRSKDGRRARVVLMSATGDHQAYLRYFAGVAAATGEHGRSVVDKVSIPDYALSLQSVLRDHLHRVRETYLEQAVKLMGNLPEHEAVLHRYMEDGAAEQLAASIHPAMYHLVGDLVAHIHYNSQEAESQATGQQQQQQQANGGGGGAILIFLATYRSLEQMHTVLKASSLPFAVYALHSSIDVDECVKALHDVPGEAGMRKVLLATNIAESSVTIHNVSHVIDLCRSVQVSWDREEQRQGARLVWASKSQCRQRAGRTGRMCSGTVYRMLPRAMYHKALPDHEPASLPLLSLRREVLLLMSSEDKAINNASGMLAQCLDPPDADVVTDAAEYLEGLGAVVVASSSSLGSHHPHPGRREVVMATGGGRRGAAQHDRTGGGGGALHEPTTFGLLLASMPVSLDAALLVVAGGCAGLLHEGALLAALLNITPYPVVRPFGEPALYRRNLQRYCSAPHGEVDPGHAPSVMATNLAAFAFFDVRYRDRQRAAVLLLAVADQNDGGGNNRRRGRQAGTKAPGDAAKEAVAAAAAKGLAARAAWAAEEVAPGDPLERWCGQHGLVPSALQAVEELSWTLHNALHRWRPTFLDDHSGPPAYYRTIGSSSSSSTTTQQQQRQQQGGRQQQRGDGGGGRSSSSSCSAAAAMMQEHECQLVNPRETTKEDKKPTGVYQGAMCTSPCASADMYSPADRAALMRLLEVGLNVPSLPDASLALGETTAAAAAGMIANGRTASNGRLGGGGRRVCNFFQQGRCRNGDLCSFAHVREEEGAAAGTRALCSFHLSPSGCRFGDSCRYLHAAPVAGAYQVAVPRERPPPPTPPQFEVHPDYVKGKNKGVGNGINGSLASGLLPPPAAGLAEGDCVLVLGDGDFSFSRWLLLRAVEPAGARLVATSLDTREQVLQHYPAAASRLQLLGERAEALHGVDATRLLASPGIPWDEVTRVVWNFPFLGVDEDPYAHEVLIADFFRSLAAALYCREVRAKQQQQHPLLRRRPLPELRLSLCNNQIGRWSVLKAARESFFFLHSSEPFDTSMCEGYSPKRNTCDDAFPHEAAICYTLRLMLPAWLERWM